MRLLMVILAFLAGCQPPPSATTFAPPSVPESCQQNVAALQALERTLAMPLEEEVVVNPLWIMVSDTSSAEFDRHVAHFWLIENQMIEHVQTVFDHLTTCRLRQAEAVRADRSINRPQAEMQLASVHVACAGDVRLAVQINQLFNKRSRRMLRYTSTESLPVPPPPQDVVVIAAEPLRLNPHPDAPMIGRIVPNEVVTVSNERNGYVLAETMRGPKGYVPMSALHVTMATKATGNDPQTLARRNAAQRDAFAQSISVMEYIADHGEFDR